MASVIDPSLPAADMIAQGLADLAAGTRTLESLVVQIGAPRLRRIGIELPESTLGVSRSSRYPEDELYALLAEKDQDSAHSRYNALVRALVSFERAAESASR